MRPEKITRLLHYVLLVGVICVPMQSIAQTVIRHIDPLKATDRYMVGLLKLALSYSEKRYTFEVEPKKLSRARSVSYVKDGKLTLIWGGTTVQMEQELAPVRIPAYKGLFGYRVFIIPEGSQAKFDEVQSLADMKRFTYGQGRSWSATEVLKNAEFNIITATTTDNLLHMTDGGRFDGFPRGIHEPWAEINRFDSLNLTVEKNLLLVYKLAYYFFVNPENKTFAQDIERGLMLAIADGSFDRHFYNSPQVKGVLSKADITKRSAYYIDNPQLPPNTPVDQAELWLDLKSIEGAKR